MNKLNLTLKVWRQKNKSDKGKFETHELNDLDTHMSFLEMMDVLNEKLISEYSQNKALLEYRVIIEELIDLIKPKRIQLNGKPPRLVFQEIFGIDSEPLQLIDDSIGMYVGFLEIKNQRYH